MSKFLDWLKKYLVVIVSIITMCIMSITSIIRCNNTVSASASSSDSYPNYGLQGIAYANQHYIFSDLFTVNLFTDYNDTVLSYTGNGLVIDDNFNNNYPLQSTDNRSNYNYLYYTANNDSIPLVKQYYNLTVDGFNLINSCAYEYLISFNCSRIRFSMYDTFVRLEDLQYFVNSLELNATSYCDYRLTYATITDNDNYISYTSLIGSKNMSSSLVFQSGFFDNDLSITEDMAFFDSPNSDTLFMYISEFVFEVYTYSGSYSNYTYESPNISYFTSFTDQQGNISFPYNNLFSDYLELLDSAFNQFKTELDKIFLRGFDFGYDKGLEDSLSPTSAIFDTVSNFFDMEILPNFSFGWFLSILLGVSGLIILLKMFLGG